MKDAVGGERAGEVPNNLRSGRLRMGEPPAGHAAGPTTESIGGGRAPWELKHLSTRWKRNQIRDSPSSGERTGKSPNRAGVIARGRCSRGVVGRYRAGPRSGREVSNPCCSRTALERQAIQGDSPVGNTARTSSVAFLSTTGHEEPRGKPGGPPPKAKYPQRPIANEYREGKVKRTPEGE
jgi:hypothetical protein